MHIELDVSSKEPIYSKTIFGVSSKEEDFVTANRKLLVENHVSFKELSIESDETLQL